jgi:hypothetical protein
MDPAFAVAVCRYDLTKGPVKLSVPVSQAYTSVTFYTRYDVAYYAVNDRSASRRAIELDLMTTKQHDDLPEDEDVPAADRLIVNRRPQPASSSLGTGARAGFCRRRHGRRHALRVMASNGASWLSSPRRRDGC